LHREIILPLLVGVQCAGFLLYGTPLIYTQEIVQDRAGSMAMNRQDLIQGGNNTSFEHESSFEMFLPKMSSCVPGAHPEFNVLRDRGSFSYLHENIDDDKLKDPMLELMPLLKNVSKKNLIPIIDFEEFNNSMSKK
jgi:hypothetical protein